MTAETPLICLNCKHWGAKRADFERPYQLEGVGGRMRCALALDVYQPPEDLKVHLQADGYECEGAEMFTTFDYGCNQYEAKSDAVAFQHDPCPIVLGPGTTADCFCRFSFGHSGPHSWE